MKIHTYSKAEAEALENRLLEGMPTRVKADKERVTMWNGGKYASRVDHDEIERERLQKEAAVLKALASMNGKKLSTLEVADMMGAGYSWTMRNLKLLEQKGKVKSEVAYILTPDGSRKGYLWSV